MNLLLKKVADVVAVSGMSVLLLGLAAYALGLRINTTRSIPVGVYMASSNPLEKGAYVLFCPPRLPVFENAKERGYIGSGICPGQYGYMMKKILAARHDTLTVNNKGVQVNGRLLPHSRPLESDSAGRPLPKFIANNYVLASSELLLMSDVSDTSFDGRYFGLIDRAQVESVIRPIFTWQTKQSGKRHPPYPAMRKK